MKIDCPKCNSQAIKKKKYWHCYKCCNVFESIGKIIDNEVIIRNVFRPTKLKLSKRY